VWPSLLQAVLLRLHMPESNEFIAARKALESGVDPKDIGSAGAARRSHSRRFECACDDRNICE
jgi:hypothetical protein